MRNSRRQHQPYKSSLIHDLYIITINKNKINLILNKGWTDGNNEEIIWRCHWCNNRCKTILMEASLIHDLYNIIINKNKVNLILNKGWTDGNNEEIIWRRYWCNNRCKTILMEAGISQYLNILITNKKIECVKGQLWISYAQLFTVCATLWQVYFARGTHFNIMKHKK